MAPTKVIIVDGMASRRALLERRAAAHPECRVLAVAQDLTEAFHLCEELSPDAVAIASDQAARSEFEMFFALLHMTNAGCVIFGTATDFNVADANCLPLANDQDAADILARLCKPAGQDRRAASGRSMSTGPAQFPSSPDHAASRSQAVTGSISQDAAPQWPGSGYVPDPMALIVIGASTGGILALEEVLRAFPANCPPTVIVQHLNGQFVSGFVQRLDGLCAARVVEGRDRAPLLPGTIHIASGNDRHLEVAGRGVLQCRLVEGPAQSGHRPSVDTLFNSASGFGPRVVAAILTGMGRDGAAGMARIRRNGGRTFAQDKATCVVHGMPRVAVELGGVQQELPLNRIAGAILNAASLRATSEERLAR